MIFWFIAGFVIGGLIVKYWDHINSVKDIKSVVDDAKSKIDDVKTEIKK